MTRTVSSNRRNNFWGAIIGAVVGIGTGVAKYVIASREAVKPEIDYVMYNDVYMDGNSFIRMKNAYAELYKKNSKYFESQYNYWVEKRAYDIKNGTHESLKKVTQNKTLTIILLCVIAAIIFLIFRNLKK